MTHISSAGWLSEMDGAVYDSLQKALCKRVKKESDMKWKIVFKESSLEVGMKFNLQQKCAYFIQEKLSKFHRQKKSYEYL